MPSVIRQALLIREPLPTTPKVMGNARGITESFGRGSYATFIRGLTGDRWKEMLSDVLASIRTLICTATNSTPNDRFFGFPRRRSSALRIANWLAPDNNIYVKNFVRNKSDPLVKPAKVVEVINDQFVRVQRPSGTIGFIIKRIPWQYRCKLEKKSFDGTNERI